MNEKCYACGKKTTSLTVKRRCSNCWAKNLDELDDDARATVKNTEGLYDNDGNLKSSLKSLRKKPSYSRPNVTLRQRSYEWYETKHGQWFN